MKSINTKKKIEYNDNFIKIINGFVFECPSSIRHNKKSEDNKKTEIIEPVSKRGRSFKERNIQRQYLNTILAFLKSQFPDKNGFQIIKSDKNIEAEIEKFLSTTRMSDKNIDFLICHERNDMPKTEAVFYYIRNAIAHGYFEVIKQENVYKMKCIKNNKLKSAMRLHENILINFIEIACKNVTELKKLQNKYLKNK